MTTLYVSDIKTSISLSSQHLNLYRDGDDGETKLQSRLPLHCLQRVAVVGRSRVSMRAVHSFMRLEIPVHVLEANGRHAGSFLPHRDGDALLRIRQYQLHESPWAIDCARAIISEKLLTSRRVIQKLSARDTIHGSDKELAVITAQLQTLNRRIPLVESTAALRGIEGAGSAAYFKALGFLFPETLCFRGRNRRPPRDPVNALLSWIYTLITIEFRGAITAAGLDPCIGFYHTIGYGRPSLALDLMETFRAPLCDLLAVRLLNLGILKTADFSNDPEDGCRLEQDGRRKFFEQFEKRMTAEFHLYGESKPTCYRDLIRRSVSAYVDALRSQTSYKPFSIR